MPATNVGEGGGAVEPEGEQNHGRLQSLNFPPEMSLGAWGALATAAQG